MNGNDLLLVSYDFLIVESKSQSLLNLWELFCYFFWNVHLEKSTVSRAIIW